MKLLLFAADAQLGAFIGRKASRAIRNGIWARTLYAVEAHFHIYHMTASNKPEVRSQSHQARPHLSVACLE